jgi:hypothetical protein
MEKKGDLLNQFAVISDLIEKVNMDFKNGTLVFELNNVEFNKTYDYISKKQNNKKTKPSNTFMVKMGNVDIVFNKNSDERVQSS